MKRACSALAPVVAGAITLALAGSAHAAPFIFDGGPDGTGTNYNTGANWDTNSVPAQGDTASITGFTVDVTGGTAGDGLGTLNLTNSTLNITSQVETKGANISGSSVINVDYGNSGKWIPRHAANTITFSPSVGNYPTLKLILASGNTPMTTFTHEKVQNIDNLNLIIDVTNLTKTVDEANPLVLFNPAGGNSAITGGDFRSVQFVGGSGYEVTIVNGGTANVEVHMIPEPTSLTLLGLGAMAALRRRQRDA
jgi:hypothetical protein